MNMTSIPSVPVLIIDDEPAIVQSMTYTLTAAGLDRVVECTDPRQVKAILAEQDIGLVLLDINMPHITGEQLLPKIIEICPGVQVIMVTCDNDIATAVRCMRLGAFDYLVKPITKDRLLTTVRNAIELVETRTENLRLTQSFLREGLANKAAFSAIHTQDERMIMIFKYIEAIARTSLPVLVTGETGTGKELISRSIHTVSGRSGEFVAINVAGVDETLFCDTLFGHEKGAFTGAEKSRIGLIEKAGGGTLFLDEIGELSLEMQVRMLRLLQERTWYPVGSDIARTSDCRIVAATNRNLFDMVNKGTFRGDLFYRLQYHQISLPPLRTRRDDIELLVYHFISESAQSLGIKEPPINRQLFCLLNTYDFPGNVRELQAMVFDAVSRHSNGVLSTATFKEKILYRSANGEQQETSNPQPGQKILFPERLPTIKETVEFLIEEALSRARGNQTVAAELLGITRRALNNRLRRE